MPNIQEACNYSGEVKAVYLDEKTVKGTKRLALKCKVETTEGKHGYPEMLLTNEAGSPSTKDCDRLTEICGWNQDDPNELKTLLMGKVIDCYSKASGDYFNHYFSNGRKGDKKPVTAPEAVTALWKAAKGGGSGSDLPSPPEGQIPF